jgi:hypothetical protein
VARSRHIIPVEGSCSDAAVFGENATLFFGGILQLDPTGFSPGDTGKLLPSRGTTLSGCKASLQNLHLIAVIPPA